ncbi:MAG: FlgD immunoglobulin-like domain containing protein [Bacteroidota bacterium]
MTGSTPDYLTPDDLSVEDKSGLNTTGDWLNQNYPNPFSETTSIEFELTEKRKVNVAIYDFSGNLVKLLSEKIYTEGKHILNWDGTTENGSKALPGTYFVVLSSEHERLSRKAIGLH